VHVCVFLRARWFEVCSHLIPVRGASEKPAAPSSKSATTHIVGAIMASERDVRLSQQILHQSVNVTTDEFVAWWWEHMNDQGETAEATSGSDSADESAYDEAAAGGEHDDDEAGASAQAVQDEAYAASSVMDAMLGAEDKQGGGKEKRMADEEPAIEHLEHYRNCGDCSPHAYFSSPSPSLVAEEGDPASPTGFVCVRAGGTDGLRTSRDTVDVCGIAPRKAVVPGRVPALGGPRLARVLCFTRMCVLCVSRSGQGLAGGARRAKVSSPPFTQPVRGPLYGVIEA